MTADHRLQVLESFRVGVAVLLYPLQFLTHLPTASSDWIRETFSARQKLQEENAHLRTQQLLLKARLQKLDSLMAENMRLRKLFDSSFNVGTGVSYGGIANMAIQTDGKILLAGGFSSYNGISRQQFARINTDGSLDLTFITGTGLNGYVSSQYDFSFFSDNKIFLRREF